MIELAANNHWNSIPFYFYICPPKKKKLERLPSFSSPLYTREISVKAAKKFVDDQNKPHHILNRKSESTKNERNKISLA